MPWTQAVVAFLAGYGLMSLVLWLLTGLGWLGGRPCTTSAVVLARNDEHRIEGILRSLHRYWTEGRLVEILVAVRAHDATRELAARLAGMLPGISLLPEGAGLDEAIRTGTGETFWLIDLARAPGRTAIGKPPPPAGHGGANGQDACEAQAEGLISRSSSEGYTARGNEYSMANHQERCEKASDICSLTDRVEPSRSVKED